MNGDPAMPTTDPSPHTPGHYVMEGTVNGKPFTREFVDLESYNALHERFVDLLALAKQYASECSGCDGTGDANRFLDDSGIPSSTEDCEDCADIRAVIDKAEGRS